MFHAISIKRESCESFNLIRCWLYTTNIDIDITQYTKHSQHQPNGIYQTFWQSATIITQEPVGISSHAYAHFPTKHRKRIKSNVCIEPAMAERQHSGEANTPQLELDFWRYHCLVGVCVRRSFYCCTCTLHRLCGINEKVSCFYLPFF